MDTTRLAVEVIFGGGKPGILKFTRRKNICLILVPQATDIFQFQFVFILVHFVV